MARGTWGGTLDRHPMQVRISYTNNTNIQQTGFYLRSAAGNITSPQEVADDVLPWVSTNFINLLGPSQRIVGIDVVDLVTKEGAGISLNNLVGSLNIAVGESRIPSGLCAVVNMKGELRTRYGQGRMFWPLVTETHIDGDVLNASGVAAMQGTIDALTARFTGNTVTGHNLICVHGVIPPKAATPTRPAQEEVPPSWYDVGTIRLNTFVTYLRSRKAGVGS